jgi:VanZ family protein
LTFIGYLPALAWAALVLFIGSRPFADAPSFDLPVDKAIHFVLYGILGLLAASGWRIAGRRPALAVPLVAALLVGAADEMQQRGIATRSADWRDYAVDAFAVGLAFLVVARTRRAAGGKRG